MADESVIQALLAAHALIEDDDELDAAQLALAIEAFLAACGLDTGQVIEANTPSSSFAQFTGSANADFLVHAETFPAGTVVDAEPGVQAHICSAPVAVVRYVEGHCPRCGREE